MLGLLYAHQFSNAHSITSIPSVLFAEQTIHTACISPNNQSSTFLLSLKETTNLKFFDIVYCALSFRSGRLTASNIYVQHCKGSCTIGVLYWYSIELFIKTTIHNKYRCSNINESFPNILTGHNLLPQATKKTSLCNTGDVQKTFRSIIIYYLIISTETHSVSPVVSLRAGLICVSADEQSVDYN